MAQTTGQVSLSCGKVEISLNGTDWTDISGTFVRMTAPEQGRMFGDTWTLEGDDPLQGKGPKEAMEVPIDIVYTETDAEAFDVLRTAWEAGGCGGADVWLRYSPRGGNAGDQQYESTKGFLSRFQWPGMDATAGGTIVCTITFRIETLATSIIAS